MTRIPSAATAEAILEAAERRARDEGYHGFSFRDLAADVGIKSASVHHHFPTKETLVIALIRRYRERFLSDVRQGPAGRARVAHVRRLLRDNLTARCQMCLCGVLSAESHGLPAAVGNELRGFFQALIDELATAVNGHTAQPTETASQIVAQLEGAAMLCRAFGDITVFDRATAQLGQAFGGNHD